VLQRDEAALLVAGMMDGDKTLITGPTGSGKSSLVKYVCAKLNRPFIRINMSGDVESAALFGTLVVRGGATVWEDGAITEAAKYGAVCLVDEWELMPAEIAMGMQNLLEDGGYLYLKEKPGTSDERTVHPNDDFRLVFAGNTVGQGDVTGAFSGVGVQNTATIDRFTNTIRLGYLSQKHEVDIITSKSSVDKKVATDMVRLASLVRTAYEQGKVGLTISHVPLSIGHVSSSVMMCSMHCKLATLRSLHLTIARVCRSCIPRCLANVPAAHKCICI
jgi:MoxR-like ATPase